MKLLRFFYLKIFLLKVLIHENALWLEMDIDNGRDADSQESGPLMNEPVVG